MRRDKKSNNIFSKPILPESLFYEQVQKDYRVGGVKIEGTWLKNSSPQIYRSSVKSALQLSQLKAQLEVAKKDSPQSTTNLFKMAELKKRMENFQLLDVSPTKRRITSQDLRVQADNLRLQKINTIWGLFERKCKIQGKQIIVFSEKEKIQKTIDIKNYTIEFEQKGKVNDQSKDFVWPQTENVRLFLFGQNLRSYCIYGQQKTLKNIVKKIRIQSIKIAEVDFFKALSKQFQQKLLILFGNKLRSYEHLVKEKYEQDIHLAFDLLQKSHLLDDFNQQIPEAPKFIDRNNSFLDQSFQNSQSSAKNPSRISGNKSANANSNSPGTSSILSPQKSPSIIPTESQFKMRARRSTINYEQIQNDNHGDYKVQDFTLQIKQVAHSDSQQEIQSPTFAIKSGEHPMNSNIGESNKRKPVEVKKMELIIPEFMDQDSFSEDSNLNQRIKSRGLKPLKNQQNFNSKFELVKKQYTHELYFAFFEDFCSFHQPQFSLTFFQKVIPQIQYANMKTPVCTLQTFNLKRDQNESRLFNIQNQRIIKVSKYGSYIGVIFDNKASQQKQQFELNLNKILYTIDQSQFLYIKNNNKIQCAGKIKLIISPQKINMSLWAQQTTEQFLLKYVIKQTYTKQDKYRFIDYKKRNQDVCQKWNNKIMKRIINKGDQQQFLKSIFYGFSPKLLQKIINSSKYSRSFTRTETRMQVSSSYFSNQCFSLMETQIMKLKVYDLRVFIKINKLVDFIATSRKNQHFQKRIDDISTFFSLRYGRASIQRFMAVLTIQILRKMQGLLLQLKHAKHIQAFLEQYFEVQYEIDDLMTCVSAYFN